MKPGVFVAGDLTGDVDGQYARNDEQQRLNAALLNAAREWRATFDAMGDPVALLDENGRVQRCNRALCGLLNLPFDRILGRSCWDLVFGQSTPLAWREFVKQHHDGRGRPSVVKRDGDWFEIWMDPMQSQDGGPRGYVYVMANVTRRELAREETQRLLKRLRTLHQIDRAILDLFSPERIARDALDHMRELVPFCCASVLMLDADTHALAPFVLIGGSLPPAYRETVPVDSEIEAFLRSHRPFYVEDVRSLGSLPHTVRAMNNPGIRAFVAVPLLANHEFVGSVNLGGGDPALCEPDHIEIVREIAASLAVSLQNARLLQSVTLQQAQIRAINARMAEVEESERKRLATDLHDRIGQNLTTLGIHIHYARERLSAECAGTVAPRLDDSLALVDELSETIRDVMTELRPPLLDDYGLRAALKWYVETYTKRTGVHARLSGALAGRLPISVETILFRMTQELMTNVVKHARAAKVYVRLEEEGEAVRLIVVDDGIGFDVGGLGPPRGRSGWGLVTLRERAEALGGHIELESTPGVGTRAVVTVHRSKQRSGEPAELALDGDQ